ncbi:MAG: hypothetical protein KDC11_01225 [Chitinophagaceae bacterium]|nr:hypothetical protein [Chitinophagaceae bacterium]
MKKLLLPLLLFFCTNAFSQSQDLIALAQGDFLGMNALFEEDGSLFGYISIYNYGKSGDLTKKFEYVILDKNLNPFANNTFQGDITAGDYYGYIRFDGTIILRPSRYDYSLVKRKDMFTPSSMVIDLKDNSVKKKIFYEYDHGTFKEIKESNTWKENRKEYKEERKEKGFNYIASVGEIKEGGFLVHEYDDYGSYGKNNHLMRFDENKNKMWTYEYNLEGSRTTRQAMYYLEKDENHYYALLREYTKSGDYYDYGMLREGDKKTDSFYVLVIDMKTGKELHKKYIPDPDEVMDEIMSFETFSYGSLDNDHSFDDKIVMVGRMHKGINNVGISRLLIDRKTFEADLKVLTYKEDFKKHIPEINAKGYVGKGYFLDPRDIFFMKDGSVAVLFEKYQPATQYTASKTTDMIYVHTDKSFNIQGATVLEKEKSRWLNTDYLFSQTLNDENDLVFFYRDFQKNDETKDKNWNLFINTFIGGKFKQEMIPISSKDNFFIFPYVAKEGYILLQEYNTKAKYNQIRLERLNY